MRRLLSGCPDSPSDLSAVRAESFDYELQGLPGDHAQNRIDEGVGQFSLMLICTSTRVDLDAVPSLELDLDRAADLTKAKAAAIDNPGAERHVLDVRRRTEFHRQEGASWPPSAIK